MVTRYLCLRVQSPDTTRSNTVFNETLVSTKLAVCSNHKTEVNAAAFLEHMNTFQVKEVSVHQTSWIHHSSWTATEYDPLTFTNPPPNHTGNNSRKFRASDRSWSLSCKAFWNSRKVLKKSMDCKENTTIVTWLWTVGWLGVVPLKMDHVTGKISEEQMIPAFDLHWNLMEPYGTTAYFEDFDHKTHGGQENQLTSQCCAR